MRGGAHIVAYTEAIEKRTGVDVGQLLPIPDVSHKKCPKAKAHEEHLGEEPALGAPLDSDTLKDLLEKMK